MKRIDDKIKEIEKKDKRNRIIFIIVVAVIAGWYIVVTQKSLKEKTETIAGQDVTITEQLEIIEAKNDSLQGVIETLEKSLTPQGFWDNTVKAGTAKAFISYILNKDIEVLYPDEALEELKKSGTSGTSGWLFVGRSSSETNFTESILDVVWRKDGDENMSTSKPQKGDIVKLKQSSRNLYSDINQTRNAGGWSFENKAIILEVEMQGDAVFIEIKH